MKTDRARQSIETGAQLSTDVEAEASARQSRVGPMTDARRRQTIILCLIIFLTAMGVRLLSWHDTRQEVWNVQTVVVDDYRNIARLFRQGGISSFLSRSSPLANPNTLNHPPGYSILMALLFSIFGESDAVIQFFQIACDALAAVVIFLTVSLLLPRSTALISGLLVALSPQFAWNCVLLLPDSLSVLPLVLAAYCVARAYRCPRMTTIMLAGALVGLSCWLRANAMLLAPFMALAVALLFRRGRRLASAAALLGGALLVIAPLTIRNAIVFRHFIPISLGAGQTFLEGIADYDEQKRFGIPDTDMGIMKWESEIYNRPDYYGTLFNPDGIARERMRLATGFRIVRSNPVWFFGVMIRRGASMLRLERVRLTSPEPPVAHALAVADASMPAWTNSPAEWLASGSLMSAQAQARLSPDGGSLQLTGDDSKYGVQLASAPVPVRQDTDYVLVLPVKIERGRAIINVMGTDKSNTVYASNIIETVEAKTPEEQPVKMLRLPFVTGSDADRIQVTITNGASKPASPIVHVGPVRLFELGPASYVWTRVPRKLIRGIQKLFLTAIMLPLTLIGVLLLAGARRGRTLLILLVVPAYYLCVQSATHTEYRYVLAVHYFLFTISAVTLSWLGGALWKSLRKIRAFRRVSA
ncbi:MAG TPA: glycosyltransferase family 39 protein [Pyrinomonadaceae bacterium]